MEEKASSFFSNQVMTNQCCGLAVIFGGFISHLIGRETIKIPEIFSGVHGFTGKTVRHCDNKSRKSLATQTTLNFSGPCGRVQPAKLTNHSAHTNLEI